MELPTSAQSTQAAAYEPTGLGRRHSWRARVCLVNTQEVELMLLRDLQIPFTENHRITNQNSIAP